MNRWLRSLFRRQSRGAPEIEPTMDVMRETRRIADELNQGKTVTAERFRAVERKLTDTGNIVETALRGNLGRPARRGE